jgi:hypothetical protein
MQRWTEALKWCKGQGVSPGEDPDSCLQIPKVAWRAEALVRFREPKVRVTMDRRSTKTTSADSRGFLTSHFTEMTWPVPGAHTCSNPRTTTVEGLPIK